jgi:hypothetical protein
VRLSWLMGMARFAIVVIPVYDDPADRISSPFDLQNVDPFAWSWLSTINRVNSQVHKVCFLAGSCGCIHFLSMLLHIITDTNTYVCDHTGGIVIIGGAAIITCLPCPLFHSRGCSTAVYSCSNAGLDKSYLTCLGCRGSESSVRTFPMQETSFNPSLDLLQAGLQKPPKVRTVWPFSQLFGTDVSSLFYNSLLQVPPLIVDHHVYA